MIPERRAKKAINIRQSPYSFRKRAPRKSDDDNSQNSLEEDPIIKLKGSDFFDLKQDLRQEAADSLKKQEFKRIFLKKCPKKVLSECSDPVNTVANKTRRITMVQRTDLKKAKERAKKREEQQMERLRMKTLMEEDEEGYRKLLDQKKDVRLTFLLQQTDDFINDLKAKVVEHKQNQRKKGRRPIGRNNKKASLIETETTNNESLQDDFRLDVIEQATGQTLEGIDAPLASEIDDWLSEHPGWLVSPKVIQNLVDEKYEEDDYYALSHDINEKILQQPSILKNGQLKNYQIQGLEWMVSLYNNNLNGILADEMGLGKTIQTIALLAYLIERKKNNGPFLIIAPLSVISNWALEFDRWAPSLTYISYKGYAPARKSLQQQWIRSKFNVLITSYEFIIKDKAFLKRIKWKYMIIDEGHRLKNHKGKLTQILFNNYNACHRLILTGTPLQNNLPELWTLMNFLLPSVFKSCNTFEQWFNTPFSKTGERIELNEEEKMLVIRRLHKILRPFLLRRLKKEVESDLPKKTEIIIKCEMSALQRVLHQHMRKHSEILIGPYANGRSLEKPDVQLRKICDHPFLFQQVEEWYAEHAGFPERVVNGADLYRSAGKFELLDRILPKFKQAGHRVLIFSQMTKALTILEDYLHEKAYKYLRIDGSTNVDERSKLLSQFNSDHSEYFIFLLSTRAGGLGINLQTADTVIIFDSDWNPHQDLQAQDRAHRIGQKNEVLVLRFITANSIEDKVLATAKFKLNLDEKVIKAGMFDQKSTERQRRLFLESVLQNDRDGRNHEDDIPDDKTINEIIARNEEEFQLFQRIDEERKSLEEDTIPKKSRLVDDSELPVWVFNKPPPETFEEDENKTGPLGRPIRRKKPVNYGEFLSDKSEGAFKKKKAKKRKHDSEDEWEDVGKEKAETSPSKIAETIKNILDEICNYIVLDSNKSPRKLVDDFMDLPKRDVSPKYYETIKEPPIDLKSIQARVVGSQYENLTEFQNDFHSMCRNALVFCSEDMQTHKDALLLKSKFAEICNNVPKEEQDNEKATQMELNNNHLIIENEKVLD